MARVIAAESTFHVQMIRFLRALLVQQQQRHVAAAAAAAACEEQLEAVECLLQQQKGEAHPDVVYGRLAAAGAAYLEVYREHEVLLQLAALRLLLQQQATALHSPDIRKVEAAALRLRRRTAPDEHEGSPLQLPGTSSSSSSNNNNSNSSSSMRLLGAAELEGQQQPAELGGYCLQALIEDKALVQGDIHAGNVSVAVSSHCLCCCWWLTLLLE